MRFSKSLIVAKQEFIKTVRRKGFIISAFLVPVLIFFIGFVSSLAPTFTQTDAKIGFIDNQSIILNSKDFIKLNNTEHAKQLITNNTILGYFIVEDDFLENKNISIFYAGSNVVEQGQIFEQINSIISQNLINKTNATTLQTEIILNGANYHTTKINKQGEIDTTSLFGSFIIPYAIAFLLVLSILTSAGYLMEGIGEEKESKTGEMLISSISTDELLVGKVLGYGGLGLVQVIVWSVFAFIAIIAIFGFQIMSQITNFMPQIILGIVFFILAYLLFAASIAAVSSLATSAKEAQQFSSVFTFLAVSPLIFSQTVISSPDSLFSKILSYIPYTAPTVTMMRMSLTKIPIFQFVIIFAILIITILLILKFSSKVFRLGMLLSGKKVTIKEIFKALKSKEI